MMNRKVFDRLFERALLPLCAVLMIYANYLVFLRVPNERVMGPVQRIFYFHVGSAIACYLAFAVVLAAAIFYLSTRERVADCVGQAAAEVAFIFSTIVLASGMIWGHSAWNTWFRWEPRLVSFLLLWLLAFSLVLLRFFGDEKRIGRHAAVLGILGAVTIPVVVFSVKLLPQVAQLHPQVVNTGGLKDPLFKEAMYISMAALMLLQGIFIWIRARISFLENT